MTVLLSCLFACNDVQKEKTSPEKTLESQKPHTTASNAFPTITPYYYQAKYPKSGSTEEDLDNCPQFDRMRFSLDNSKNTWAMIQLVVTSYPSLPEAFQKCDTEALFFDQPDGPGYSKKQNEETCSREQSLRLSLQPNTTSIAVQDVTKGKKEYVFKLSDFEYQIIFIDHKGNTVKKDVYIGCGD